MNRRSLPLALLTTALVVVAPAAAHAAAAADDIDDAPALVGAGPHFVNYDTDLGSAEAGEQQHVNGDYDINSVWAKWTPTKSGGVKLSSCGPSKPLGDYIKVYKKGPSFLTDVANLKPLAWKVELSHWDCDGGQQIIKAVAGQTYFIVAVRSKYVAKSPGGTMTLTQMTEMPKTTFTSAPAQTGPTAKIAFSAPNQSTFWCKLDEEAWVDCAGKDGSGSFTKTFAASGKHTLTVRAYDSFHNAGPETSHTFDVDAGGPDTVIDSPAPVYGGGYPKVLFHASESAGVTFKCGYDGPAVQACTSPWQLSTVPQPGPHKLTVVAFDKWGNPDPTPAVQSFTIVQTKGVAPVVDQPVDPQQPQQPPVQPPVVQQPPVQQPPVVQELPYVPPVPACAPRVTHGKLTKRGMKVRIAGDARRSCAVTLTLRAGRRTLARQVRTVAPGATASVVLKPRVKAPRGATAKLVVASR